MPGVGEESAQIVLSIVSKATIIGSEEIFSLSKIVLGEMKKGVGTIAKKARSSSPKKGEQSIAQLSKQGKDLNSVPVSNDDIKTVKKQLKGYGVDFSVLQDKNTKDYTLFFKATDTVVIQNALEKCVNKLEQEISVENENDKDHNLRTDEDDITIENDKDHNKLDDRENKPSLDEQISAATEVAAVHNAELEKSRGTKEKSREERS
ncbi:hypothetical protein AGMMS50284_4240 [Clostridia bacterium]|nr:hypothetical protein AGMMS50284_4240 [Clostridia bacterium]